MAPKLPILPPTSSLTIMPTEHSFLEMPASLVLTVTMASVVPNGDTVEVALITVEKPLHLMEPLVVIQPLLILLVILLVTLLPILPLILLLIAPLPIAPPLTRLPLTTLQFTPHQVIPLLITTTITLVITAITEHRLECAILTKTANTENIALNGDGAK